MIYAIPNNRNCVANHFMKAPQFTFLDEDNAVLSDFINPAAGRHVSCADKKSVMDKIKEMNADAVIVRNIGERALGKLLSAGIRVFQVSSQTALSEAVSGPMLELTEAAQGRPSHQHNKKGGCSHGQGGGCGCGGSHDHRSGMCAGGCEGSRQQACCTK